jgi:hypothetical protein
MSKNRLLSICLGALLVIWMIHFATNNLRQFGSIEGHTAPATEGPSPLVRALRPSYPYSVIPGGAYTPVELRFADGKDDVVRAHYSDFDVKHAKLVTLTDDRFQYVSYRVKNQIFWTKKRLRIPKGELLLTDGVSYARARCGNRLSDTPHQASVNPQEPDQALLSLPTVSQEMLPKMALVNPPALGGIPGDAVLPSSAQTGAVPSDLAPSSVSPNADSKAFTAFDPIVTGFIPGTPITPGVPVLAAGGAQAASPASSTPITTGVGAPVTGPPVTAQAPPPAVAPVPEPSSLYLFLISLVISVWALVRMTPRDESDRR